jgi:hypothetical protein
MQSMNTHLLFCIWCMIFTAHIVKLPSNPATIRPISRLMRVFSFASCKHFLLRREEQVARRFVFSAVVKYTHRLSGFGLALPALLNDAGVLGFVVAVVFLHGYVILRYLCRRLRRLLPLARHIKHLQLFWYCSAWYCSAYADTSTNRTATATSATIPTNTAII